MMARHCVAGGCEPRSSDAEAIDRVVGVNADEVRTVLTGAVPVACITGTYCGMARDVAVLTNVTAREVE